MTKPRADECRRRKDDLMQRDEDALVQRRQSQEGLDGLMSGTPAPATESFGTDLPTGRGGESATQAAKTSESTRTAPGDVDMGTDESQMRGLKRPAETDPDDEAPRSLCTESTEHLDGDMPVTAPSAAS